MNRESLIVRGNMEQTITLIKTQIVKIKEMQILQNQTLEILIDKVRKLEGETLPDNYSQGHIPEGNDLLN